MKYGAVGLVEVIGSSNAILVADQMLKAADVQYACRNTKCGGHVTIFLYGDVAAVTAAVETARNVQSCKIIASAVISNPSEEMVRLVEEQGAKKK